MRFAVGLMAVVVCTLPYGADAQPVPGAEFRVNSYLPDSQQEPKVAADASGGFVVVWESFGQDGSAAGIFARRFSAGARPLSAEFRVNTYTTGVQDGPNVAMAPGGAFTVVWNSLGQDGSLRGVFARRFSAEGVALGDEFQVNATTAGHQAIPLVAVDAAGGSLISWVQQPFGGSWAQRFDSAGNRVGSELALASWGVTDLEATPTGFLAVGEDAASRMFAVRLDGAGAPLGPEFQVWPGPGGQYWPVAGVDAAGGFVVSWQELSSAGSVNHVMARRFDAAGAPRGPAFAVTSAVVQESLPRLGVSPDGRFVILWTADVDLFDFDVRARRFDASGAPVTPELLVNQSSTVLLQLGSAAAFSPGGQIVATWQDDYLSDSFARQYGLIPARLAVDTAGNGVLEAGEAVGVETSWANKDMRDWTLTGGAGGFGGPGVPALYSVPDRTATYGSVPDGAQRSCADSGDCYAVAVAGGPRPSAHWDATFEERLSSGGSMRWILHIGDSFTDVPRSSPFYRWVETLLHHAVSGGCGGSAYCPAAITTRGQMAAFLLAAREGAGYQPPPCTTPEFADLPASSPFCPFVEELARRGVVAGCGGGNYCPDAPVTREQMALLVLRTLSVAQPQACGTPMFADVPPSSPYCRWIEELVRRGVVTGCGGGNYCPSQPVTREQMAVFLSATFGLTLYGP
jgi:hypothetical protein